jgi:hypothetical protein
MSVKYKAYKDSVIANTADAEIHRKLADLICEVQEIQLNTSDTNQYVKRINECLEKYIRLLKDHDN